MNEKSSRKKITIMKKAGLNLNVVLLEPEIPQNTGSIARTCAATGVRLHLIKPLGFSTKDKDLKRAGLDYWHLVDITYHESLADFFENCVPEKLTFFTKKAARTYDHIDFKGNVFLIFGKETTGIPDEILNKNEANCFRIPMKAEARSLNLSNAVSIVVYEALRQNEFPGLAQHGEMAKK
ncbi:tRNA (uridine(34)/cytosine(34)/5-carboxymethylaminomethyluridine(34)-2'-O)-methyltransferase TrmL [Acidobacteriota bacterium]